MNKNLFVALLCLALFQPLRAQNVALKTNLLYDATLTVNAGIEVGLAPKWSFDLSGNLNAWTFSDDKRWKHWLLQPEVRYWLCDRFSGHFFGLHALGGQYSVGNIDFGYEILGTNFGVLKHRRFEGWGIGAGIAYGYAWVLGKHWNFEAEIGIGYIYTRYDEYDCGNCGREVLSDQDHHYVGLTKAALNLVYVF